MVCPVNPRNLYSLHSAMWQRLHLVSGSIGFIVHRVDLCGPQELDLLVGHHMVDGRNTGPNDQQLTVVFLTKFFSISFKKLRIIKLVNTGSSCDRCLSIHGSQHRCNRGAGGRHCGSNLLGPPAPGP